MTRGRGYAELGDQECRLDVGSPRVRYERHFVTMTLSVIIEEYRTLGILHLRQCVGMKPIEKHCARQ
jgi:hypothetical protein